MSAAQPLPTVKIINPKDKTGKSFVRINEADFDPEKHKLWKEREPAVDAQEEKKASK